MGVCNIRNMDMSGMLGKTSRARRTPIIRTIGFDGQMERYRIGKNEGLYRYNKMM